MSGPELRDVVVDSTLSEQCPHCSAVEDDSFETLENDTVTALRCGACRKPYFSLVFECRRCTEENVVTWRDEPAAAQIARVRCSVCTARYHSDDDDGKLQEQLLE